MRLWKTIKRNWEVLKSMVHFIVGDGRVGFWLNRWCGKSLPRESFPTLFVVVSSKDAGEGKASLKLMLS